MGVEVSKLDGDHREPPKLGINATPDAPWDRNRTHMVKFDGKHEGYGNPPPGSQSEARAIQARQHVNEEVALLLCIIKGIGTKGADGKISVSFGKLFEFYERISDKLVGMLLRARRWKLVDFPGEMLYQGQDNNVLIRLLVDENSIPASRMFDFESK